MGAALLGSGRETLAGLDALASRSSLIRSVYEKPPVRSTNMDLPTFIGSPEQIGLAYGRTLKDIILQALSLLLDEKRFPRSDATIQAWVGRRESLIEKHFPWLLEEMAAVAQGVGLDYQEILWLNCRVWNYCTPAGATKPSQCSTMAITLADGTLACTAALDDPPDLYCGPVRFGPEGRHRFITLPISGMSWAADSMNSAGLAIAISSLNFFGEIEKPDPLLPQDIAIRAIMEQCSTADEVREFCREHSFQINLVAVDAQGGVFAAQSTPLGLFEVEAEGFAVITNHWVDDAELYQMAQRGGRGISESDTTRFRRGRLLQFARQQSGHCSAEEVREFMGHRDDTDPGSNHNAGTLALTFANPQAAPQTFWIMQPKPPLSETEFVPYEV